ncbi:hypothetical protein B0H13DRAFT_2300052 [Mycena leptocephala]|nr:hypothetical protein B0H13DRAFT_2300052 [Mycena leptocephala]
MFLQSPYTLLLLSQLIENVASAFHLRSRVFLLQGIEVVLESLKRRFKLGNGGFELRDPLVLFGYLRGQSLPFTRTFVYEGLVVTRGLVLVVAARCTMAKLPSMKNHILLLGAPGHAEPKPPMDCVGFRWLALVVTGLACGIPLILRSLFLYSVTMSGFPQILDGLMLSRLLDPNDCCRWNMAGALIKPAQLAIVQ